MKDEKKEYQDVMARTVSYAERNKSMDNIIKRTEREREETMSVLSFK